MQLPSCTKEAERGCETSYTTFWRRINPAALCLSHLQSTVMKRRNVRAEDNFYGGKVAEILLKDCATGQCSNVEATNSMGLLVNSLVVMKCCLTWIVGGTLGGDCRN